MGKFQGLLGNGALCDYCLIGYNGGTHIRNIMCS